MVDYFRLGFLVVAVEPYYADSDACFFGHRPYLIQGDPDHLFIQHCQPDGSVVASLADLAPLAGGVFPDLLFSGYFDDDGPDEEPLP